MKMLTFQACKFINECVLNTRMLLYRLKVRSNSVAGEDHGKVKCNLDIDGQ